MPIIPLFGASFYSKSANVTRQMRTNLYAEVQKDNDRSPLVFYPTPGLTLKWAPSSLPSRGAALIPVTGSGGGGTSSTPSGNYIYTVHGNTLYSISPLNVITAIGTLNTTSGYVSMSWNGTQLTLVDGVDGFCYTPSTAAYQNIRSVDADFPTSPQTVTYLNGYTIVSKGGTGQFWWSALLNSLSWNGLDFATAESSPDNVVAVWSDYGELYLFGQQTTEVWGASSGASVWQRLGGAAIEWGLAAQQSVTKFSTGLIFLAINKLGETQVIQMQGYQATPVSDPEVSNAINRQTDLSTCTGFSYLIDGHPFYQLNLTDRSFLFDAQSEEWSSVSSGIEGGRQIGERRVSFVSEPYVTDYANGNIYLLDKTNYTENGSPIIREIISRHVFQDYDRTTVWELQLDLEVGVGLTTGQGSDPQAMLQVSKDGGHTWGNEIWTTIGPLGNYLTRVIWRRLGQARNWLFKLRISDPIKIVIIGGALRIE